MPTRYFRVTSSGQWLDAKMSAAIFATTTAQNATDLGTAVGQALTVVEVADGQPDPRSGGLLSTGTTPLTPDQSTIATILAKPKATRTAADLADALDVLLRHLQASIP